MVIVLVSVGLESTFCEDRDLSGAVVTRAKKFCETVKESHLSVLRAAVSVTLKWISSSTPALVCFAAFSLVIATATHQLFQPGLYSQSCHHNL